MVRGFAWLLGFQLVGELLARALHLPLPGNVIGMALLLAALFAGIVRIEWVQEAAELLLSHMALFFVPAGVGVMAYFGLIARAWLPIAVATIVSSLAVLAVTGWSVAAMQRGGGRNGD
jgi:holin-like protein